MKKLILALTIIAAVSVAALGDIPSPNRKPRVTPTPVKVVVDTTKPAPTPKKEVLEEYNGTIRVFFDTKEPVPVLEIRKSSLEKLIASNGEASDSPVVASSNNGSGFTMGQTLVSGVLFSVAFIVGGVWIFRARGGSRTAAGLLLGAVLGGATVTLANSPPDYVVRLTSRVFNPNTKAYGWAENKVKIRLMSEDPAQARFRRDDVVLIVPYIDKENRNEEE